MARRRRLLLVTAIMAGAFGTGGLARVTLAASDPPAHPAATCADYPTQLAAQNAADTRDADHDGIYCEDNPCPCSAVWHAQHGGGDGNSPGPPARPRPVLASPQLGRSIAFGHDIRTSDCHTRDDGRLPDPLCTPGAYYSGATRVEICRPGYASSVRDVSEATKDAVYRAYGIVHHSGATFEMDHLVPLEIGGSNVRANLFPEAAAPTPGFHQKDEVENRLHDAVCSGRMGLRAAQRAIARDWLAEY